MNTNKKLLYYCNIIGSNIKRLRGRNSQRWLAEKAKVARATVRRIESGEPISLENLIRIAETLEVEVPDLFVTMDERKEISYKTKMLVDKIFELGKDIIKEIE